MRCVALDCCPTARSKKRERSATSIFALAPLLTGEICTSPERAMRLAKPYCYGAGTRSL
jgi:hypothetical protein